MKKGIKEIIKNKKPDLFISGHSHILKIIHDKELNLLHMNLNMVIMDHKAKTIISFNVNGKEIKDLKLLSFQLLKN